jgi:ADP-ribose pyrophosphatase YjhB (NUDIX family)
LKKTARAIIKIDDDFLFIKRTNKPNAMYIEYYAFIGGHVEDGENFEEACIREVYEELGINIKINELFYEMYNEDIDTYEKFYIVDYIDGELGTGKGEEFTNQDETKYGKYEIVKIKKEQLKDYFILPEEVKDKLIDYIKN